MAVSTEPVEVEWQFDAPDLDAVADWLLAQPPHAALQFRARPEVLQLDDYFDSADWRISRAGFTLRTRRRDDASEVTLKSTASSGDGPRRRIEINEALAAGQAAVSATGPVGERLRTLLGPRPLRPLFRVETRRRRFDVTHEGAPVAEIALDETRVGLIDASGDAPQIAADVIRRVEIEERTDGGLDAIALFSEAIQAACGLTLSQRSKFGEGLRVASLDPSEALDFGPLAPETPDAAAFAFATLRRYAAEFLAHEPGTLLGDNPEELHDMRVAARRLRAAFSAFRPVLPSECELLREQLRGIAAVLGEVRDLDVQLEALETQQEATDWEHATALGPLLDIVRDRRGFARAQLLATLHGADYDSLVAALASTLRAGPATADEGNQEAPPTARAFGRDVIRRRYRQFRRDANRVEPSSDPAEYHALRIRGKRLRYSVEFFEPLFGRPAARFARAARGVQDVLGEHQDAAVAIDWLRALARDDSRPLPRETLVALGELTQHHRTRMETLRGAYPAAYRDLRNCWPDLRGALEEKRPRPARPSASVRARPAQAAPTSASQPPLKRSPRTLRLLRNLLRRQGD